MQTSDYITSLQNDKQNLVDNLNTQGVEASNEETFTELVPKVLDIQGGGGDSSEYFNENISYGTSSIGGWMNTIKQLPAFNFNGTNASYMFASCGLETLDLSNFDTSNVTNMLHMFEYCSSLTSLDLSNFDTSKVTGMSYMFLNCSSLTSLDLSNFDTSKVTGMTSMFQNCNKLTTISQLDCSKVEFTSNLFTGCLGLTNLGALINIGKGFNQKQNNYSNHRLSLSGSKLTKESLLNVINGLYDLNLTYGVYDEEGNDLGGTLYTQQLQLGTTNLAKLTEEEIAIATAKGWAVS